MPNWDDSGWTKDACQDGKRRYFSRAWGLSSNDWVAECQKMTVPSEYGGGTPSWCEEHAGVYGVVHMDDPTCGGNISMKSIPNAVAITAAKLHGTESKPCSGWVSKDECEGEYKKKSETVKEAATAVVETQKTMDCTDLILEGVDILTLREKGCPVNQADVDAYCYSELIKGKGSEMPTRYTSLTERGCKLPPLTEILASRTGTGDEGGDDDNGTNTSDGDDLFLYGAIGVAVLFMLVLVKMATKRGPRYY